MRKHISRNVAVSDPITTSSDNWLDLERVARVELTSEEEGSPIESALRGAGSSGWRAASPGEQVIRLIFDEPQPLRRIFLQFHERVLDRTQEFVLRWSNNGKDYHEIVRQQWNFSPNGSTEEQVDYPLNIQDATVLELRVIPDVSGGGARANLTLLRIAV